MMKVLDPPLFVRIYFTSPQHKNIYMIHGMRESKKVGPEWGAGWALSLAARKHRGCKST